LHHHHHHYSINITFISIKSISSISPNMPHGDDPFTAFIATLRSCLVFVIKNLFYTVLNLICVVLFIVAFLPPWRLYSLLTYGCYSHGDDDRFQSMSNWREYTAESFCGTLFDLVLLPIYIIACILPTRFVYSLKQLCGTTFNFKDKYYRRHWDDNGSKMDFYTRGILVNQAFSGILDMVGIAMFLFCFLLPWPVAICRILKYKHIEYKIEYDAIKSRLPKPMPEDRVEHQYTLSKLRQSFQTSVAFWCIKLALRTLLELFTFPLFLFSLLIPTRTIAGLRMFGNVFYWRVFMKWDRPKPTGSSNIDNVFRDQALSKWLWFCFIEYFTYAICDLLTFPALLVVLVLGSLRISKMINESKDFINLDASNYHASNYYGDSKLPYQIWANIWPCRSNIRKSHAGTGVFKFWNLNDFLYFENSQERLYHLTHYNGKIRTMIWKQSFFCLLDILILPFALLGIFGIVHTVPLFSDILKHWKRRSVSHNSSAAVPVATGVSAAISVTPTQNVPNVPGYNSSDATTFAVGSVDNPLQPWTAIENDRYDLFMDKFAYNWLLRVDLLYHGVMTVRDILPFYHFLFCICTHCYYKFLIIFIFLDG
jgi:hypothetical protein